MACPRFCYFFNIDAAWLSLGEIFAASVLFSRCLFLFGVNLIGSLCALRGSDATALSSPPIFEHLIAEGRAAEAAFQPERALVFFRHALEQKPEDAALLQAISKQLSDELDHIPDRSQRLIVEREALETAQHAARLAPKDGLCLTAVAVCEGKLARDAEVGERIEASREVKRWADAALQVDPKSEWAEHVLGMWNLEVAQISPTRRALARMFYGAVPEGSFADAVEHLRRATELGPQVALHHLALGFAYSKSGDITAARAEWKRGLALPSHDLPDETAKAQAREAMTKSD